MVLIGSSSDEAELDCCDRTSALREQHHLLIRALPH